MTKTPKPRLTAASEADAEQGRVQVLQGDAVAQMDGPTLHGKPPAPGMAAPPHPTKAAVLRAGVSAPGGASMTDLIRATGWQAHTIRAALSGLRKSGLALTRRRVGTDAVYGLEPASREAAAQGAAKHAAPESVELSAQQGDGSPMDLVLATRPKTEGIA